MRKLLLGILISLPVLFAQPFPHQQAAMNQPNPAMGPPEVSKKPDFEDFLDGLGLKSAEKQKMINMWFEQRKRMIDMKANVEKMEIDMQRLLMANKLDEEKILQKAKELGEARVNQKIQDLKFKLKLLKLVPNKHKEEFKRFLFLPKSRFFRERLKERLRIRRKAGERR